MFRMPRGHSRHGSSLGLGWQLEEFPEAKANAPVHTSPGAHPTCALGLACPTGRFGGIRAVLENKPKPDSSETDLIPVEGAFEVVVGRREINSTGLVHLFSCRHLYMALLTFNPMGSEILEIPDLANISH